MAAPPPPPPPPPSSQTAAAGSPWPAGALVFAGCREQDVALAKLFWNSATLQPPLESRLGGPQLLGEPSDSRRGSNAPRRSHFDTSQKSGPISAQSSLITSRERIQETIDQPEKSAVKGPYLEKAKRREEILALLRKQREERIMKEAISQLHKPKTKPQECKIRIPESDLEDRESVKALP